MAKFLFKGKDGGSESNVTGYWLIESKRFFSIVLLRFDKGSREAFHTHAFNSISWILSGWLIEHLPNTACKINLKPSLFPVFTSTARMHKVEGVVDTSWVLSFRGPWANKWFECIEKEHRHIALTNGRKQIGEY